MRRGDVWWADLPPPSGARPVLLLSRDSVYRARGSLTIAPLTTRIRGISVEVPVGPEDGVPRASVVNLDDIQTIPKASLDRLVTSLSAAKMDAVNSAIRFALDLD